MASLCGLVVSLNSIGLQGASFFSLARGFQSPWAELLPILRKASLRTLIVVEQSGPVPLGIPFGAPLKENLGVLRDRIVVFWGPPLNLWGRVPKR